MSLADGFADLSEGKLLHELFLKIGLSNYQSRALSALTVMGTASAAQIASASGVPRSRVYDVLSDLFRMGLVSRKSSSPTVTYESGKLRDLSLNFELWLKRRYAEDQKSLVRLRAELEKLTSLSERPRSIELFKMVQVGGPSERETGNVVIGAKSSVSVVSRAFEHYGRLRQHFIEAAAREVRIRIILLSPRQMDTADRRIQSSIVDWIERDLRNPQVRYCDEVPVRLTLGDAGSDSTKAVLVAEQRGVPLLLREAAVTENPSMTRMLSLYFETLWKESYVTRK